MVYTFRVTYKIDLNDDLVFHDDIIATGYRLNHDGSIEFYRKVGVEVITYNGPPIYGNSVPTYYDEDFSGSSAPTNNAISFHNSGPTYENVAVYPSGVWKKVERLQPIEEELPVE